MSESDKMEEFEKLLLDHEEAVRFSGSFTWISPTREYLLEWARAALSEPDGYVLVPRTDLAKWRRVGFLEGQIHGIEQYAIWRDGRQLVGVMQRDLKEVLKPHQAELAVLREEPK